MEHLNREALARLVDESPEGPEGEHLRACATCRAEFDQLTAQTRALASLPEIRPPLGDWEFLEARLRSEGLVRDRGVLERVPLARTPAWMRAAAAVALFAGGTVLGAGLNPASLANPTAMARGGGDVGFVSATSVEDAASALRAAEQDYVSALTQYRLLLDEEGGADEYQGDPSSRFAALEYLLAASQAAVRQAPADPFLNGLLASTRAERDATLRRISSNQDSWF